MIRISDLGKDYPEPRKLTVEQIVRPLLAIVFIVAYFATQPARADAAQSGGEIRHYESTCQTQAREAHGVPVDNDAYAAYVAEHLHGEVADAELQAYWDAFNACPPAAKFDFGSMTLVHVER